MTFGVICRVLSEKKELLCAKFHRYRHLILNKIKSLIVCHRSILFLCTLFLLILMSMLALPAMQHALEKYFSTKDEIDNLRDSILTGGSVLVGASAVITSIALFSMQVNIDRMPHSLFRLFSRDDGLLRAFGVSFLLPVLIIVLSTLLDESNLANVVHATLWLAVLLLVSFFYSFSRVVDIVDPSLQFKTITERAGKALRAWRKRGEQERVLFYGHNTAIMANASSPGCTHDYSLTASLLEYKNMTDDAIWAVDHAISFSRNYALKGDYVTAENALSVILEINFCYIECKGKTFYCDRLTVENPFTADRFINFTLNSLLKYITSGFDRRDEQQVGMGLNTVFSLLMKYIRIDYSDEYAIKSHARLAFYYMAKAINSAIASEMVNVIRNTQRLMGEAAVQFFEQGDPRFIATVADRIALPVHNSRMRIHHNPATLEGITQLAKLTFTFLNSPADDSASTAREADRNVYSIAVSLLATSDEQPPSNCSFLLAPYYSSSDPQGLSTRLQILAAELSMPGQDVGAVSTRILNISRWSSGLSYTTENLLLVAVGKKSQFTSDLFRWIVSIAQTFLQISTAPACDIDTQSDLQENASSLVSILSRVPVDEDSARHANNCGLANAIFDSLVLFCRHDCSHIASVLAPKFISWMLNSEKYFPTRGVLSRFLCGIAALVVNFDSGNRFTFNNEEFSRLVSDSSLEMPLRNRVATEVNQRTAWLEQPAQSFTEIEIQISQADPDRLRPLLSEIARILSSE